MDPVLLTYRNKVGLETLKNEICSGEPQSEIRGSNGLLHQLWVISNNELMQEFDSELNTIKTFYVADFSFKNRLVYHYRRDFFEG